MSIVWVCSGDPALELARQVASMRARRSGSSRRSLVQPLHQPPPREDEGPQIEIRTRSGMEGVLPEAE